MNQSEPSTIKEVWNRISASFTSNLDLSTNHSNTKFICDIKDTSVNSLELPVPAKKTKLNQFSIAVDPTNNVSHLKDVLKNIEKYLVCSYCHKYDTQVKQCSQGHLFCSNCTKPVLVYCSSCDKLINRNDLSNSEVANKLASLRYIECNFCKKNILPHQLPTHSMTECTLNFTSCDFVIYGCCWKGPASERKFHTMQCALGNVTVKEAEVLFNKYCSKKLFAQNWETSMFNQCLEMTRNQITGVQMIVKPVSFTQFQSFLMKSHLQIIKYTSSLISYPYKTYGIYNFNLEMTIVIDYNRKTKKIYYSIKTTEGINLEIRFIMLDILNQENNCEFVDVIHHHRFELNSDNESPAFKLIFKDSMSIDKVIKNNKFNGNMMLFVVDKLEFHPPDEPIQLMDDDEDQSLDELMSYLESTMNDQQNESLLGIENEDINISTITLGSST